MPTTEQDQEVFDKMEDLKQIALSMGYPQYYYYAYDLVQTYLFNHGKKLQAMELVAEMRHIAVERNERLGRESDPHSFTIVGSFFSQIDWIVSTISIQRDSGIRIPVPAFRTRSKPGLPL